MRQYLSLIKFSHTVFALPFALIGFFLGMQAEGGHFSWQQFLLVLACMVFARSAAMAFNRYLDSDIDAKNARTAVREIPAGVVSRRNALIFVLLNAAAFYGSCRFIEFTLPLFIARCAGSDIRDIPIRKDLPGFVILFWALVYRWPR
jgi:4-hydroxybenzoate polyprenyltransferase